METGSLRNVAFIPLRMTEIHPQGWLKRQLRIQADGLSGHLDEFWPDIKNSQWFGGDSESWERAPYWLDGAVPLAYILNDTVLIKKVTRYINYILENQSEDGWLGPKNMVASDGAETNQNYDLWAQFLILKVLVQYHDATNDTRIPDVIERNLRCIERSIDRYSLFNWAQFRWFETLIAIYWLYERQPQQWLLDLATKLQAQGFHWGEFTEYWCLQNPTPKGTWSFMSHVVNHAMAVKSHGLIWRKTGSERDRTFVYELMQAQDRDHGMVTGVFSGDECLSGKSPLAGTELCAVVEYAYSLEILLSILGDPKFGDRLEKVIFNALPATFSPDMWSHQYDQQVNQVECSIRPDRNWSNNGPESNIFGLEPNYGCCTANLSQGWPKFAAHLWMKTPDKGLAAMSFSPCKIKTVVDDVNVEISVETDYPFCDQVQIIVKTDRSSQFPLSLRIPTWAKGSTIFIDEVQLDSPEPGTFYKIDHQWSENTVIILTLPMTAQLMTGYRNAMAIERGPLVYSLPIAEKWKRVNEGKQGRELPHADWEIYPEQEWNYGLKIIPDKLQDSIRFEEFPIGDFPFSPEEAPIKAKVMGKKIPRWKLINGSADEVPMSPVESIAPLEELTLIPYGCTNLRITEFPILKE